MLKEDAKVYKMKFIRSEGRNDNQHSVNIIAMSWNDAEDYLRSQIPEKIRIEERGGTWDINAVTPHAIIAVKPQVITKTIVKERDAIIDIESEGNFECPWCKKPYKLLKTLENHMKKEHMAI
jgi:hypothetical protein